MVRLAHQKCPEEGMKGIMFSRYIVDHACFTWVIFIFLCHHVCTTRWTSTMGCTHMICSCCRPQVAPNSPGEAAGLEGFFDFILAVNDIRWGAEHLFCLLYNSIAHCTRFNIDHVTLYKFGRLLPCTGLNMTPIH